MKKHLSTIIPVLVFIVGLSLLLYPTVSNFWNVMHQSRAVANYSDVMDKMDQQEKQAAVDAAAAYNESLLSNADRFNLSEDELSTYKSLLNADGTGMIGYITIPSIDCKLAIYHTVDPLYYRLVLVTWKVLVYQLVEKGRMLYYPVIVVFLAQSFLQI